MINMDQVGIKRKPVNLLLIQDDQGDRLMFKRTLQTLNSRIVIHNVIDGQQGYDMFDVDSVIDPVPNMVILDLNLPKINGLQILMKIRQHPIYKDMPVIVLTTSKRVSQINLAYKLKANTYFAKPHKPQQFKQLIKFIDGYWGNYASVPEMI